MQLINPRLKFTGIVERNDPSYILVHSHKGLCDIYHMHKNAKYGFEYHYLIRRDGTIEMGRPDMWAGSHCKEATMNYRSISICVEGNFDNMNTIMPDIQFNALVELTKYLVKKYNIPNSRVDQHSKYATDDCPGIMFPWGRYKSTILNGKEE